MTRALAAVITASSDGEKTAGDIVAMATGAVVVAGAALVAIMCVSRRCEPADSVDDRRPRVYRCDQIGPIFCQLDGDGPAQNGPQTAE